MIKKYGDTRTLRSNRMRYRIYRDQKGLCAICDRPLDNSFEVDHILAYTNGGRTVLRNLQAVHPLCNKRKGHL